LGVFVYSGFCIQEGVSEVIVQTGLILLLQQRSLHLKDTATLRAWSNVAAQAGLRVTVLPMSQCYLYMLLWVRVCIYSTQERLCH